MVVDDKKFYCFSTGNNGDIWDMVKYMEGCNFREAKELLSSGIIKLVDKPTTQIIKKKKKFKLQSYITSDKDEVAKIIEYGKSRRITRNYYPCRYYQFNETINDYEKLIGLGFPHRSKFGAIVGVKIRNATGNKQRWTVRGDLGSYFINNNCGIDGTLWVVESETSSNSLNEYLYSLTDNYAIISFGSVTCIEELPNKIKDVKKRKLIIDYDGDESQYRERLELYKNLECEEIKLPYPKGEDINSLYCKGISPLWKNKI